MSEQFSTYPTKCYDCANGIHGNCHEWPQYVCDCPSCKEGGGQ